jgi:hypothetical protein
LAADLAAPFADEHDVALVEVSAEDVDLVGSLLTALVVLVDRFG